MSVIYSPKNIVTEEIERKKMKRISTQMYDAPQQTWSMDGSGIGMTEEGRGRIMFPPYPFLFMSMDVHVNNRYIAIDIRGYLRI